MQKLWNTSVRVKGSMSQGFPDGGRILRSLGMTLKKALPQCWAMPRPHKEGKSFVPRRTRCFLG
jgi:hypothetical protein